MAHVQQSVYTRPVDDVCCDSSRAGSCCCSKGSTVKSAQSKEGHDILSSVITNQNTQSKKGHNDTKQ